MNLTNTVKGIAIIWVTINFILFIASGNYRFADGRNSFITGDQYTTLEKWYPNYEHHRKHKIEANTVIASNRLSFDPKYSYDLSEFLLYSLVPILFFVSYRLIKEKNN